MTATATRTNGYAAACADCKGWVRAGAGVLTKEGGKWLTRHAGTCPPAPTKRHTPAAEGYYHHDGKIIVVVKNKRGDRTYAKVLTASPAGRWSWEYAPGVGASVAGLSPVSLSDAAAWGHLHGSCLVCCRSLTDPASVERGIGPVCAKKFS